LKHKNTAINLLYFTLIATVALGAQTQIAAVRVYVFTAADPGGFVDANSKQRTDSVEDLKKDLSKDSAIQIIPDQATADVTLEVLGRGHEETGSTTSTLDYYGQWHTYPDTVRVVRVGLKAGAYTTLFEGTSSFAQRGLVGVSQGLWRVAASGAAKDIENWIRANHDNLVSRRPVGNNSSLRPSPQGGGQTSGLRDETPISSPVAVTSTVSFASIPDGADVYVDGEFVGNSPATLKLEPGKHEITAKMSGYQDWNREITASAGVVNLNAQLEAASNSSDAKSGMTTRPEPARIAQEESGTGWIGVTTIDGSGKGVVITRVLAGSPAERARLQVGDVIEKMDGVAVKSGMKFDVAIAHSKPGSQIRLSYVRGAWASGATVMVGKIGYETLP
jgi:hypothetical protein